MKRWLFVIMLALVGCSFGEGGSDIQINLSALSAADVTKVNVTITGPGMSPISKDLVKTNGVWKGTIGGIPVGTGRIFTANAFNASNNIIYSGQSAPTTITKNNTSIVLLTLQQVNAPPPFNNAAPVIDSLISSSNAIATTDSIELSALLHDPNGDPLTISWTANGGSFSNTNTASTQWTAPNTDGNFTLNFSATDNKSATNGVSFQIQVSAANAKGKAKITTVLNTWPEIQLINASPAQIDVNEFTQLSLTTSDPDGDPLSFSWSADCAGSFNNTSTEDPTFTLTAPLPLDENCILSVVVTDGLGGSNTGSFTIVTGPPQALNTAPQVDTTFQSVTSILGGTALFLTLMHTTQTAAPSILSGAPPQVLL